MKFIDEGELNIRMSINLLEEMKFDNLDSIEIELRNMEFKRIEEKTKEIEELYKKHELNKQLGKAILEVNEIGAEAFKKKHGLV